MRQAPIPLLVLATLGFAAFGPAAHAQLEPATTTVQVTVSSAGLDLGTPAGAKAYLDRLTRAAGRACGGRADSDPLFQGAAQAFQLCRTEAVAGAIAHSRSPLLRQQFAAARGGQKLNLAER